METQLDFLGGLRRTHTCGQLRAADAGARALLMGWVHRHRDLGGVIFIHLRDRDGVTQIAIRADADEAAHRRAEQVRPEYVIAVEGTVALRSADTVNPNLETGEVEIFAEKIWILNESRTPPFPMEDTVDVAEEVRLKYRYVDLRRPHMQRNIILRSKISFAVRECLYGQGFLEIETPFMTRSTPEGRARLPGAQPRAAGQFLRVAAIAANLQATADGRGVRQVFPDRALLPR
jgi:aspartyl-tRNA synthetase